MSNRLTPGRAPARSCCAVASILVMMFGVTPTAADKNAIPRNRASTAADPRPWRADQAQTRDLVRPPLIGVPEENDGSIALVLAGDPDALPSDDPSLRVDANVPSSPLAGVCAVEIDVQGGTVRCTGAPISPRHVLTAAHCIDLDDDGLLDPGLEVRLVFNVDGNASHVVTPEGVHRVDVHPDYHGFPQSVHDDLAIITLVEPLPESIPRYPVARDPVTDGELLLLVGYGQSGNGIDGITLGSSPWIKRVGSNRAELFFENDETGTVIEIWSSDFDAPNGGLQCMGAGSLGNDVETCVAGGDSGGPVLVQRDGVLHLWGTSTFATACAGPPFHFGSRSSGMVASGYLAWIDTLVECDGNCNDCDGNGVPDGVDLLQPELVDLDGDGLLDACEFMGPGDLWIASTSFVSGFGIAAGGVVLESNPPLAFIGSLDVTAAGRVLVIATDFAAGGFGVYELDPVDGALLGVVVPESEGLSTPVDLLVAEDGSLLILNAGTVFVEPTITRHDPTTGALLEVLVADDPDTPVLEHGGLSSPVSMEFGPDGAICVADHFQQGIPRFDAATGASLGLFAPDGPNGGGFGERALVFHGDDLFVLRQGEVLRFDAHTGAFEATVVDGETIAASVNDLEVDGAFAYVANHSAGRIDRFDLASGAPAGTLVDGLTVPTDLEWSPPAVAVPGDLDQDGDVDAADLGALLEDWGTCRACSGDLNGDGSVDGADLALLLASWTAPS